MKKFFYLYVMLAFVASCGKDTKSKIVAKIGSEKITIEDLSQRMKNAPLSYQEYLSTQPGKEQFLDILVKQKIMIAMAKKNNIHKKKDFVNSMKELKNDYKNKIKQYEEELLIETYLKELENTELKITDVEIEKYYNEHKNDYQKPTEVRLSHILVGTEEEAKNVIKKLEKGDNFEELAKTISIDPVTNVRGGDLGTFGPGEL
ncbi:MAG: peptidylprolyl isomerase, partial [Endomicrobiia bacterium]